MNALAVIVLDVLLMTLGHPNLEDQVVQFGNKIEEISFYFNVVLFLIIAVILATVDVMLLKRLKVFYPAFY